MCWCRHTCETGSFCSFLLWHCHNSAMLLPAPPSPSPRKSSYEIFLIINSITSLNALWITNFVNYLWLPDCLVGTTRKSSRNRYLVEGGEENSHNYFENLRKRATKKWNKKGKFVSLSEKFCYYCCCRLYLLYYSQCDLRTEKKVKDMSPWIT